MGLGKKKVQNQVTTFNRKLENQEDEGEDVLKTPQEISLIAGSQSSPTSPSNSNFSSPSSTPERMRRPVMYMQVVIFVLLNRSVLKIQLKNCIIEPKCFEDSTKE